MHRENDQNADYLANTFFDEFFDQRQKRAGESRGERMWAPPRESRIRQAEAGISVYNTLGPRQALFIMG